MKDSTAIVSLADYAGTRLTTSYVEELAKAGEGSRGGHVVGHTRSGKPIYGNIADSQKHDKHYTFEDHEDAAEFHRKLHKKYKEAPGADTASEEAKGKMRDRIYHHNVNANYHEVQADKKGKRHVAGAGDNVFEQHKRKIAVADSKMPDAIRNMLYKAEEAYALLLGEPLEKAGEGSKGGKVIGHTKSGKPVYAEHGPQHPDYKGFTAEDHHDAYKAHARAGKELDPKHPMWAKHDRASQEHLDTHTDMKLTGEAARAYKKHEKEGKGSVTEAARHAYQHYNKLSSRLTEDQKKVVTDGLREKVSKATEAYALLGLELLELSKAGGEGSRGGRVIGHTKSGKPIYQDKQPKDYKNFSAQDHLDAYHAHREQQEHHYAQKNIKANQPTANLGAHYLLHNSMIQHHDDTAVAHHKELYRLVQAEHEAGLSDAEKKIIAEQKKKQAAHHQEMMAHHETMFKHAVQQQTHHKSGSSQNAAFQAEQERHLAEYQKHDAEYKRLTGK